MHDGSVQEAQHVHSTGHHTEESVITLAQLYQRYPGSIQVDDERNAHLQIHIGGIMYDSMCG